MALRPEHELHRRRKSRNAGLGLVLALFVALVFGLTVVKVSNGWKAEGFDHQPRTSLLPAEPLPAPDVVPAPDAPAATGGQP